MEIMNIPKRKIDNLERLRAESDVLNTEVDGKVVSIMIEINNRIYL